jgi:tetratricopeptide (TPR) repeat protein
MGVEDTATADREGLLPKPAPDLATEASRFGSRTVVKASEDRQAPEEEPPSVSVDDALRLVDLSEPERRRYLRRHQELCDPQVVVSFCRRAAGLFRRDLPLARRMVEAAGSVAEVLDDAISSARAQRARAQLHHIEADYREALECYARSVRHYESAGEELQGAITRSCALHVLALLGKFDRADEWSERARELFTRRGDRVRLARLDANVAVVLHRRHDFEEALRLSLRAFERLRAQGTSQDVAVSLRNMLVCHVGMRNLTMAEDVFDRAREFAERHRFPRLVLEADYNIAYVHQLRGDYEQAIHLYEKTRTGFRDWADPFHDALCDLDQSEAYVDLRELEEAETLARKALMGFERLGIEQEAGRALVNLAIVAGSRGDTRESLELLDRARRTFTSCSDPMWPLLTDYYRALVFDRAGQGQRALAVAGKACERAESDPDPTRKALFELLVTFTQAGTGAAVGASEGSRAAIARVLLQLSSVAGVPKLPSAGWLLDQALPEGRVTAAG